MANQKTPTSLLLTPEGVFHSFGYTARDYYHDLDPEEARDWLYFEKFKMKIHSTSVSPCSRPHLPRVARGDLGRAGGELSWPQGFIPLCRKQREGFTRGRRNPGGLERVYKQNL